MLPEPVQRQAEVGECFGKVRSQAKSGPACLCRPLMLPQGAVCFGQVRMEVRIVRPQRDGAANQLDRTGMIALLMGQYAEQMPGARMVRLFAKDLRVQSPRFVQPARLVQLDRKRKNVVHCSGPLAALRGPPGIMLPDSVGSQPRCRGQSTATRYQVICGPSKLADHLTVVREAAAINPAHPGIARFRAFHIAISLHCSTQPHLFAKKCWRPVSKASSVNPFVAMSCVLGLFAHAGFLAKTCKGGSQHLSNRAGSWDPGEHAFPR